MAGITIKSQGDVCVLWISAIKRTFLYKQKPCSSSTCRCVWHVLPLFVGCFDVCVYVWSIMLCKNICDSEWMISKLPDFGFLSDYVTYVLSASFVGMDEDCIVIKTLKIYLLSTFLCMCMCMCMCAWFIHSRLIALPTAQVHVRTSHYFRHYTNQLLNTSYRNTNLIRTEHTISNTHFIRKYNLWCSPCAQ